MFLQGFCLTFNRRLCTYLPKYITFHFNTEVLFSVGLGAGDSPLPIYAVLVQPFGQTLGRPSPVWHSVKQGLPGHAGEPGFSCSTRRNVSVIAASPPLVRIQNGKIMKKVRQRGCVNLWAATLTHFLISWIDLGWNKGGRCQEKSTIIVKKKIDI